MTGNQLKTLRHRLGLGVAAFGRQLGYGGTLSNAGEQVRRLEALRGAPLPKPAEQRVMTLGLKLSPPRRTT